MRIGLFAPDDTDKPEGDELLFEAAKYDDDERVREWLATEMESVDFAAKN